MPEGDIDPHPSVIDAQRAAVRAEHALELLGDAPAEPPAGHGWSAPQLRDLARRLEDRALREAAALEAELHRLRGRQGPQHGVVIGVTVGALGLAAGLILVLASLAPAGVAVALAGLLMAAVIGIAGGRGDSSAAISRADQALAPLHQAADRARRERQLAVDEVRRAGLPEDPRALERLADEAGAAAQLAASHAAWVERSETLASELGSARRALGTALDGRGFHASGVDDPVAVAEAYLATCRANAVQYRAAEHGEGLRRELAARRAAEEAATAAARREASTIAALRALAEEIGIDSAVAPEEICAALDAWRAERAGAFLAAQQALGEWQQLQSLLDGGALDELQAEASRRRQRANELAEGLPAAAITLPMGVDPQEYLAGLRRKTQSLDQEHDVARGALDARRSALPDVAEAEEAAAMAHAELARVERLAGTIGSALELLRAAQERVHRDLAPILAQAVGRWLPDVSRGAYSEASVDPASLRVSVKESATGQWRDARLLSEGTREQIYLLLRVAMAEHLVTTGERAPLLLDEVTAQADSDRKRQLLDVLHRLSTERQIILFTHDDEVLAWADAVLRAPDDAVVRLQPLQDATAAASQAAATEVGEPLVPVAID
jgi:uncharacterized protein YhaN